MKYAIIDTGSNSIRLGVYQVEGQQFQQLFSEKVMAGLAGYVQDGALTPAGIQRACETLLQFKNLLAQFAIDRTFVFATASLRNITNTEDALQILSTETGYTIDLISGQEEGLLDFYGSLRSTELTSGVLLDIGGGSTEIVVFDAGQPQISRSMPIGSLNLHTHYVRKFLPANEEQAQIKKRVQQEWKSLKLTPQVPHICGVGGTARAVLKLVNAYYGLPTENRTFTARQLHMLKEELCTLDKKARTLILRHCPDRVHTILPGLIILDTLVGKLGGTHITISRYGVREGYLCRQIEKLSENL